jgi:hemerythrin
LEWKEEFATGVDRVDEDHKMIFKMAGDFRAALDAGRGREVYSTLLDNLYVYCRGHFGFEEQCMHEHRCPVAQKNKNAHAYFLETLAGFIQRYADYGYDASEARRLTDTVDRWLTDHICSIDIHLKRCVSKRAQTDEGN